MPRKRKSVDSLELLLDTICNTFGGVLFIAILVVLLLQTRGEDAAAETPEPPGSPEEYLELANRLDTVTTELSTLDRLQAGQQQMIRQFAPDDVRELLETRQLLNADLDRARSARDQAAVNNAKELASLSETREKIDQFERSIEETHAETARLQQKLDEDRKSRQKELRLPVVHTEHTKSEIGLIVRYGRAYLWHEYDQSGNRLGLNLDEFVVVEKTFMGVVARPKPTAGIVLNDSPETREAIKRRLQQFSPSKHVIAIIVRPDSYGVFRFLKDVVTDLGFEYRLIPVSATGPVQDRGGTGGRVQ
jgi:hypothetical protein